MDELFLQGKLGESGMLRCLLWLQQRRRFTFHSKFFALGRTLPEKLKTSAPRAFEARANTMLSPCWQEMTHSAASSEALSTRLLINFYVS